MTLQEFIARKGDAVIAQQLGAKPRTVASWRRGERLPRPHQARRLVELSEGALSLDAVYAPLVDERVGA